MQFSLSEIFYLQSKTIGKIIYCNIVRHFSFRRLAFTLFFLSLHLLLMLILSIGRLLDEILFPAYRNNEIKAPLFIISNPRSGTTLLHRLLSMDKNKYSSTLLYHTIFPCVTYIKAISALAAVDNKIGRPFQRVLDKIENMVFGGWKNIHPMGFKRSEEDETLFVYAGLSPAVFLLSPWIREFEFLHFFDRAPEKEKARFKDFYISSLKRIHYATNPDRKLLVKNVFSTGRLHFILDCFPDAEIIYPLRHPVKAVPSLLSMFAGPWKQHSPEIKAGAQEFQDFADLAIAYYRYFFNEKNNIKQNRIYVLRYKDLVKSPEKSIRNIYEHFGFSGTPTFWLTLEKECQKSKNYKSKHKYDTGEFGISREYINKQLADIIQNYWPEKNKVKELVEK